MILMDFIDFKSEIQKEYDNALSNLQIHRISCPYCKHHGHLIFHGAYVRHIHFGYDKPEITIQRVKCTHCKKTHALLPSSLVPYSQIPLKYQVAMAENYLQYKYFQSVFDLLCDYPEDTIRKLLLVFMSNWLELCRSYNLQLQNLAFLTPQCVSLFMKQFLQNRKLYLSYYLTPT